MRAFSSLSPMTTSQQELSPMRAISSMSAMTTNQPELSPMRAISSMSAMTTNQPELSPMRAISSMSAMTTNQPELSPMKAISSQSPMTTSQPELPPMQSDSPVCVTDNTALRWQDNALYVRKPYQHPDRHSPPNHHPNGYLAQPLTGEVSPRSDNHVSVRRSLPYTPKTVYY